MERLLLILVLLVAGCGPSYSPDTYASNAVQQANKAEQGVVIGVRKVQVSASGTAGTVTGAAAGGIAGSQIGTGATSAFAALGGSLVGGIAGSTAERLAADKAAFEYIVKKTGGELVSVTQNDVTPLALGQKVLVIVGNQARVVADYTVAPEVLAPKVVAPENAPAPEKPPATEFTPGASKPPETPAPLPSEI